MFNPPRIEDAYLLEFFVLKYKFDIEFVLLVHPGLDTPRAIVFRDFQIVRLSKKASDFLPVALSSDQMMLAKPYAGTGYPVYDFRRR